MTTYSVRCRNSACRHRRVTETHPDEYRVTPVCRACGQRAGWRIEGRAYNRRNLCRCSGPDASQEHGKHFPHQRTHPLCDEHPQGPYNQLKLRGVPDDDIPFDLLGVACTSDDAPF